MSDTVCEVNPKNLILQVDSKADMLPPAPRGVLALAFNVLVERSKDEYKEVRDKETKKTMDTMKVPWKPKSLGL